MIKRKCKKCKKTYYEVGGYGDMPIDIELQCAKCAEDLRDFLNSDDAW